MILVFILKLSKLVCIIISNICFVRQFFIKICTITECFAYESIRVSSLFILFVRNKEKRMKLIGFIGVGNMGYPMFLGAIKAFGAENVAYTCATLSHMEEIKKETGIEYIKKNIDLIQSCEYIVLAVKPQYFHEIYHDLKQGLRPNQCLISCAAGISIEDIKNEIGMDIHIARIMPNTPSLVGEGMCAICYSENLFTKEKKQIIYKLVSSFGRYVEIKESLMNAVICASGSSPAYIYMLIEALADGAVKYGIPRKMAYELVAQTVLGAAKMVLETKEHPAALKDKVCSPGGTTIAAVSALEEYGFRNAVLKATDACYEKAANLTTKKSLK